VLVLVLVRTLIGRSASGTVQVLSRRLFTTEIWPSCSSLFALSWPLLLVLVLVPQTRVPKSRIAV
jgi:hypothetical protein